MEDNRERENRIMDKIQRAMKDLMETDDDEYIEACWEDLELLQE